MTFSTIGRMLAASMQDDPFCRAITEGAHDQDQRLQMLQVWFEQAMIEAEAVGELRLSGQDAAAIWATGEAPHEQLRAHRAARMAALVPVLGPIGMANLQAMDQFMTAQIPAGLDTGWRLSTLVVAAEERGQGLGSALLRRTLRRADEKRARCWVQTFNPLSLPFLQRLGFTQVLDLKDPVTEAAYWVASRSPWAAPGPEHQRYQ